MPNRIYILSGEAPLLRGLLLKRKGETMGLLSKIFLGGATKEEFYLESYRRRLLRSAEYFKEGNYEKSDHWLTMATMMSVRLMGMGLEPHIDESTGEFSLRKYQERKED
jgi:hypothetical protein